MDAGIILSPLYINEFNNAIPFYYHIIKYLHWMLRFVLMFGWMSNNKYVVFFALVSTLVGLILFSIIGGCCITKIERGLIRFLGKPRKKYSYSYPKTLIAFTALAFITLGKFMTMPI